MKMVHKSEMLYYLYNDLSTEKTSDKSNDSYRHGINDNI